MDKQACFSITIYIFLATIFSTSSFSMFPFFKEINHKSYGSTEQVAAKRLCDYLIYIGFYKTKVFFVPSISSYFIKIHFNGWYQVLFDEENKTVRASLKFLDSDKPLSLDGKKIIELENNQQKNETYNTANEPSFIFPEDLSSVRKRNRRNE